MRSVMVFDLDGTVLRVNSFPLWAVYLLKARFPHLGPAQRLAISLRAGWTLAARKAGLIGHETLKWRLQRLWRQATAGDGRAAEREFTRKLQGYVRPELADVLAAVARGQVDAVLATAAAADYAQALGQALGFSHVLATPSGRPAVTPSNVGEHKRDAVLAFLKRQGWQGRPLTLFTDHVDDLPLIRISDTVYWFGDNSAGAALADGPADIVQQPGIRGITILPPAVP
jgi:phosphoserine phosphatase